MDHARRNLMLGRRTSAPPPVRPPWATEASVQLHCTGCGACTSICPSSIISIGGGGYPEISFLHGECTFCGACAEACEVPVFAHARYSIDPFDHVAAIASECFALSGIHCQSCQDACPESAINFFARISGVPEPQIEADLCTGCGACIAVCPAEAVSVARLMEEAGHA